MKDATISELYDLTQTIAAKIFEGKTYPWEVLPLIKDFILELGETLDPAEYEKRGENVWIAKDAVIAPTASINGPCIIGKGAEIRQCAFIRGNAIVGEILLFLLSSIFPREFLSLLHFSFYSSPSYTPEALASSMIRFAPS